MKQILKKSVMVLFTVVLLFSFLQPVVFADPKTVDSVITDLKENDGTQMDDGINTVAGTIINWLWGISIVVSVIVVMIIGLKYIIGSTQEKAEYKKSLIPLVVGIILVVFATTIIKFLFGMKA